MKKFVRNIIIFSLLVCVGLGIMEFFARKQVVGDYVYKAERIKLTGDSIQTLFIGSSLTHMGIDPHAWPDGHAFNLGFLGLNIDGMYYIFKSQLREIPCIKTVVLEMSYFIFFDKIAEESTYWRSWIPITVHLKTDRHSRFSRYGFELADPPEMRTKLLPWRRKSIFNSDSLGHYIDRPLSIRDVGWKSSIRNIADDHIIPDWKYMVYNLRYYARLLQLCRSKGLEVIVVMHPAYAGYVAALEPVQMRQMYRMASALQAEFGFRFLDYFQDSRFEDDDWWDAVHMNTDVGASKFSRILYEDIINGVSDSIPQL